MKGNAASRLRSMSAGRFSVLAVSLLLLGVSASRAATYYVATNGTGNGDSWAAATNSIQGAIDRTGPGDTVLVSNGVYEVGGRPAGSGALTNRVVITNAITVQSANNNPSTTIIKGAKDAGGLGPAAVRCVWMSAGSLIGFTLTNGATMAPTAALEDERGGGIYCDLTFTPVISNCLITGNSAGGFGSGSGLGFGGGTFCGTVNNCTIIGNTAVDGGGGTAGYYASGWHYAPVNNSLIISNTSGDFAGGAYANDLNNCLVAGNTGGSCGGGYSCGTVNNCTIVGNTAGSTPGYVGGLVYSSIIRNSIMCFNTGYFANYYPNAGTLFIYSCTTPIPSGGDDGGGNIASDPLFVNAAGGNYRVPYNSPCVDTGTNEYTGTVDLDGKPRIYNGRVDMGAYERNPATYYVATNGTGNGDSWAAATNSIQGAIDRTGPNDTVLVSNGVYEAGGRAAGSGALTNRVVIAKAITVRSANNAPATTIIKGAKDAGGLGPAAVRCVWMNAGSLIGFTLTNGATMAPYAAFEDERGGGVYCDLTFTPVISNCLIAGNSAGGFGSGSGYGFGGGTFCGTVNNCTIIGNTAVDGGGGTAGYYASGWHYAPVNNSLIISNTSGDFAGGAYANDLNNCLVAGNTGVSCGAGYSCDTVNNCTIVGNTASTSAGCVGGLVYSSIIRNSIMCFNTGFYANYFPASGTRFIYSCTTPIPSGGDDGGGNISSDPLFVNAAGGNYRLKINSPCMNTGTNVNTGTADLDGLMRIRYGTVDMGAYEAILQGTIVTVK